MALVMLPCDLPWWSVVQKRLTAIEATTSLDTLIENMTKIHDLCNVSLDPDEEERDVHLFDGLKKFVENILTNDEKEHFVAVTVKTMAQCAKQLKLLRPPRGLSFSLQQQSDSVEIPYNLAASLLANAFFSTFPKRTIKTHPTLQDFNFSYFFNNLDNPTQQAKFRSFIHYFDWITITKSAALSNGSLKMSRKIMTGKQWLTIEDWLECTLPLGSIDIRHDGRIERAKLDTIQTIFVSSRIGGDVLLNGKAQESICMSTCPELLVALIYVEALEDNEALIVENVRQVSRIHDPQNKAFLETLCEPQLTSFCCIDAENYYLLPFHQYEEDNILREMNKCLLGFRQNTTCPDLVNEKENKQSQGGRLSPIGEATTPSNDVAVAVSTSIVIKQPSTSTSPRHSSCDSNRLEQDINKRRSLLAPDNLTAATHIGPLTINNRKGRFIVLGSSGECLPVKRKPISQDSLYSSCESSTDEFHSAHESPEILSDDENYMRRYSHELDTPERRMSFAKRLKDALQTSDLSICSESSVEDNYAVGISVAGSNPDDKNIVVKRGGGSRGFMLEDSLDEDFYQDDFYKDSLAEEIEWVENFRKKQNGSHRKPDARSSEYSFSTEFSSELEEVYEQFSKWLEEPLKDDKSRPLDPRDEAVLRFASSLLKRTLSESFVGVPLTDGCIQSTGVSAEESSIHQYQQRRNKFFLTARSLSLELAKHKHRLAAQLKTQLDKWIDKMVACSSCNNSKPPPLPFAPPIPPPRRKKRNNYAKNLNSSHEVKLKPKAATKKLNWTITYNEENIECESVVLKISQMAEKKTTNNSLKTIATGNWGCGRSKKGDPQLKFMIQWMAATVAGCDLVYFTAGNDLLVKADTVRRILLDRKWTVGELAKATLQHAKDILDEHENGPYTSPAYNATFFDKLLGFEPTDNNE